MTLRQLDREYHGREAEADDVQVARTKGALAGARKFVSTRAAIVVSAGTQDSTFSGNRCAS